MCDESEEVALDALLTGSPKKKLKLEESDKEWVKSKLWGQEILD